jgi:iron-sulfur cluster repair protein YtfE (RIC family)
MGTVKTNRASVDALELLTSQHSEVDALFETIEQGKADKAAAFAQLADKLAAHATIEEQIFYPAAMSKQTNDLLHESVEEHLEIKRTLADMLALDLESDEFKAKLSVLKENVSHHAHEEEEQKLFPMLRKQLSADVLGALGSECLAMFEVVLPTHPYKHLPQETAEAAPLPTP